MNVLVVCVGVGMKFACHVLVFDLLYSRLQWKHETLSSVGA